MSIDKNGFKESLSEAFIKLLDSKRGVATEMAKSIGKPPSFVSQVKRGKPVNSLHLKAVGLIFGPKKVLELLSLNISIDQNIDHNLINQFKNKENGLKNIECLIEIEKASEDLYRKMSDDIKTTHDTVKILKNEERKKMG